jgi:hypothetical protein
VFLILARDVRIEVQQDEALACWESAIMSHPLGMVTFGRSRDGAWA